MGKFKLYIEAVKKERLMHNTSQSRIDQAVEDMRVRPPKLIELDNGLERMEYRFKMSPPEKSTEKKAHWGYADYDPKTNLIHKLWCSCKDFSYRLYYPLEKKDLATWELPKKYKKKEPFIHNKQNTVVTNPKHKLFVCKHLYALTRFYMDK